jgi:hypothetical protein
MGGVCSTNREDEKRVWVVGRKGRGNETSRMKEKKLDG